MLEGQLSLFDFAAEEEKQQYQITMPKVPEFPKGELLAFEKETLGIYVSGHPMDEYLETWKNSITAKTTDFMVDEETGRAVVEDGRPGDHWRHDNSQDRKAYEEWPADGLCDSGGYGWFRGSHRLPAGL